MRWRPILLGAAVGLGCGAAGAQTMNHAQLVAQLGHHDLIASVAFSPDGKTVLTNS
jgi:hypothetical protein